VSAELKLGWESSGRGLKVVDTKTVAFHIPRFLKVKSWGREIGS